MHTTPNHGTALIAHTPLHFFWVLVFFFANAVAVGPRHSNKRRPSPIAHNCTFMNSAPCAIGAPRTCVIGPQRRDFDHFANLILNWRHGFAFVRYADGEYLLITGGKITKDSQAYLVDKFWSDGGTTQIGLDLKEGLRGHYGEQFFYAFVSPSTGDDASGLRWYLENTQQQCAFLSYSNMWGNAMYPGAKKLIETLLFVNYTSSVVVANHVGLRRLEALNLTRFKTMELPDYVNKVWHGDLRESLLVNATTLATAVQRHTFLVSGGPMAKVLIAHMWNANKNNIYIDFGSAMDEILKGKRTRPYMDPDSRFAKQADPTWLISPDGAIKPLPPF